MRDATWLRRNGLLLGAFVSGSVLRLYQLKDQIIADDEWHAIHMARDSGGFASIASHFGGPDVSIPIALFYRLVMITIGLSESIMRAPIVFFGLLSLVVFPLIVRRIFDRTTAALFAWLLAISPMHIYFSRYARPYSISLFCAFCGICAFHLWQSTGDRRWKWLYVVCAIAGPYFHLSVLPVLCAPLALSWASSLWRSSKGFGSSRVENIKLTLVVGGGLAILLLPPIYGDFRALERKALHGTVTSYAFTTGLDLLLGVDARSLQVATLAIMALGALRIARTHARFGGVLGTCAVAAILPILITRPGGIAYPVVVARYALFVLPVLLLLLASGLKTIGGWTTGAPRPAAAMMVVAWMTTMVVAGPLPDIYYFPNDFTNHGAFQYYPSLDARRNPYVKSLSRPISEFYRDLGRQPVASMTIVEAPWYFEWQHDPYPFYQRIHRQRVVIGFVRPGASPAGEFGPFDPRFRFRNAVHLQEMDGLCARKIDRVVFHKDFEAELGTLSGNAAPGERGRRARVRARNARRALATLVAQYQRAYGPPVFEDASLIAFDATSHCPRTREAPATGR
jgi:Dolichyl-phosphate-mannose-protein mannosyltransferase